ncbi:MAG: TolC family protein [Spirochaetota bacterium]
MVGKIIRLLFVFFALLIVSPGFSDEREMLSLSIDEVIAVAKDRDIKLKGLTFSLRELLRSRKNLYRSLFPEVSSELSGTDILYRGAEDTRGYEFNVTLEQVLYNQFSAPMRFQDFDLSLEEARLALNRQRWSVEQTAATLYLNILLGEERLRNKKEERLLYQKYLKLMEEEYRAGLKTMLEVIETEVKLLEVELELEKLSAENEVLYRDMLHLIGKEDCHCDVRLRGELVDIFSFLFFKNGQEQSDSNPSFEQVYQKIVYLTGNILNQEKLYRMAIQNDFDIKKLGLALRQNELKRKLSGIQFLNSISLSYEMNFSGERFFPANTSHTIALNLFLDFGLLSSDVSMSTTSSRSMRSRSHTSESEVLEKLQLIDEGRYLKLESYTTAETLEERKREIRQAIEIWFIKMKSLQNSYSIKMKEKEVFKKNDELFRLRIQLGESKEVDYFGFLIEKNEFYIGLEELRYSFITLLWELENLINIRILELS